MINLEISSHQEKIQNQVRHQLNAYHRTPSRIGSCCALVDPQSDSIGKTSSTAARLKCSTIKRAPSAKSCLRLPVASATPTREPAGQSRSNATSLGEQKVPSSRIARPMQGRGVRPTSLALSGSSRTQTTTTTRSASKTERALCQDATGTPSILPKPTTSSPTLDHLEDSNKDLNMPKDAKTPDRQKPQAAPCRPHPQSTVRRRSANVTSLGQITSRAGKQPPSGPTARSGIESRLATGLKNLVAVVHPQHSQRVNPIPSANNKFPPSTTIASLAPSSSPATRGTRNTKKPAVLHLQESGAKKVNSHYKDVNGISSNEETREESKQDGNPNDHLDCTKLPQTNTRADTSQMNPDLCASKDNSAGGTSQLANHQDAQVLPNDTKAVNYFPASTNELNFRVELARTKICRSYQAINCDTGVCYYDGYQNKNDKLLDSGKDETSDKKHLTPLCLPEDTHVEQDHRQQFSPARVGRLPQTASDRKHQPSSRDERETSHCYNGHDGVEMTPKKLPASCFKFSDDSSSQTTVSDRMIQKPMGQQVLSLMMLDVGLMPAACHDELEEIKLQSLPCQSTNQLKSSLEQPNSPSNLQQHRVILQLPASLESSSRQRSYVSLPNPRRNNDEARSTDGAKSYLIDNCLSLPDQRPRSGSGMTSTTNRLDSPFDQVSNRLVEDSFFTQQFNQDSLHVQVHVPRPDDDPKSFSLPSSPRNSNTIRTNKGISMNRNFSNNRLIGNRGRSNLEHNNQLLMVCGDARLKIKLGHPDRNILSSETSPKHLSPGGSQSIETHESPSLASSSCSSLNHCPPLPALSNQLQEFSLNRFLSSKEGSSRRSPVGKLNNLSDERGHDSTHPSEHLTKVPKQHELFSGSSQQPIKGVENHSSQIDHVRVCHQENKDDHLERVTERNARERLGSDVCKPKDSRQSSPQFCMDSMNMRHQQTRSHSVSGQEFYSNSGYIRLKQCLYPQQNHNDQNFGYNERHMNQVQHNSSFYQHQPGSATPIGRSTSPLSMRGTPQFNSASARDDQARSTERQSRNQLHASLECLNTSYPDYHQQRQISNQNQNTLHHHYAASYILAQPPANTIINQNGDQDLAAAAMGSPPGQYHSLASMQPDVSNAYSQQSQSLVNRAMAHVSQSPLRRLGINGSTNNAGSSLLNHLTSLNHPMRAGHSTISLASSSFLIEDKLQNEIKKLQEELKSEREKNEALSSQLNINSSLMAAFEQSLTTLNTRLRQLTTLNEKKDAEIDQLREQLSSVQLDVGQRTDDQSYEISHKEQHDSDKSCDKSNLIEQNLRKQIDDLKRQLVEKDRLLTDTRLEALSAAHQLEQLESKLDGDHSLTNHEDDLDEGVMVINHSPSDSDAVTDSAHFSEINQHLNIQQQGGDNERLSLQTALGISNQETGSNRQQNFMESFGGYESREMCNPDQDCSPRHSNLGSHRDQTRMESNFQADQGSRSNPFMCSMMDQHEAGCNSKMS